MLLALRAIQGLLMPGLLVVAVPYVSERFRGPAAGAAMGAYTASLVFGGFVGRVGTALIAEQLGWRLALELLRCPPCWVRWRCGDGCPATRPRTAARRLRGTIGAQLRNRLLLLNALCAATRLLRLRRHLHLRHLPADLARDRAEPGRAGLVYGVWLVGVLLPAAGALAQRLGPQRLLPALIAVELAGVADDAASTAGRDRGRAWR